MHQNTQTFLDGYRTLSELTAKFRNLSAQENCSIGKFFADAQSVALTNALLNVDKSSLGTLSFAPFTNIAAILKECDENGQFHVREAFVPILDEMKLSVKQLLQKTTLTSDEFFAFARYAVLIDQYVKGRLYSHAVKDTLKNPLEYNQIEDIIQS